MLTAKTRLANHWFEPNYIHQATVTLSLPRQRVQTYPVTRLPLTRTRFF